MTLKALDFTGWENKSWCVPSAVAMLTGAPVGFMHVRAAFHRGVSLKKVKSLYDEEAILLLREQGYSVREIDLVERYEDYPTIRQFLKDRTSYEFCMPILFTTSNHAATCHMGYAGDNWTKKPVPIAEFPMLKRRVRSAYVVMGK